MNRGKSRQNTIFVILIVAVIILLLFLLLLRFYLLLSVIFSFKYLHYSSSLNEVSFRRHINEHLNQIITFISSFQIPNSRKY